MENFIPKEQSRAMLLLVNHLPFAKDIIGRNGCLGIRFVLFRIFAIESYTSFIEPELETWKGIRLIFWKKMEASEAPQAPPSSAWKKWYGIPIGRTSAIGQVHPHFLMDWAANARRLTEQRLKDPFEILRVSIDEFASSYHQSGYLDPLLRHGFIRVIRDHLKVHPENVAILFFKKNGSLLGGTVFVDYPDIQSSHYLISFLTSEGRAQSAGYGFIYWWYKHMLEKKLTWADFGIVWQKGDPVSWQGYSEFKRRFNPRVYTKSTYWKLA